MRSVATGSTFSFRSAAMARVPDIAPLAERHGRGFRFTADGEKLLGHARSILALHDEVLQSFSVEFAETVVIGSTEHAAAQLFPCLAASLDRSLPRHRISFRIDRGTELREAFSAGRIDLALLPGPADDPRRAPASRRVRQHVRACRIVPADL